MTIGWREPRASRHVPFMACRPGPDSRGGCQRLLKTPIHLQPCPARHSFQRWARTAAHVRARARMWRGVALQAAAVGWFGTSQTGPSCLGMVAISGCGLWGAGSPCRQISAIGVPFGTSQTEGRPVGVVLGRARTPGLHRCCRRASGRLAPVALLVGGPLAGRIAARPRFGPLAGRLQAGRHRSPGRRLSPSTGLLRRECFRDRFSQAQVCPCGMRFGTSQTQAGVAVINVFVIPVKAYCCPGKTKQGPHSGAGRRRNVVIPAQAGIHAHPGAGVKPLGTPQCVSRRHLGARGFRPAPE